MQRDFTTAPLMSTALHRASRRWTEPKSIEYESRPAMFTPRRVSCPSSYAGRSDRARSRIFRGARETLHPKLGKTTSFRYCYSPERIYQARNGSIDVGRKASVERPANRFA